MTDEPVSIVIVGIAMAGNEGSGGKRGGVCMLHPWYSSKYLLLPARYMFIHSDHSFLTLLDN